MRKLAMLAMLALVVGFVPMASAGSQVEAQADGDVHFVNGLSTFFTWPDPVDVCEGDGTDGTLLATLDAPSGTGADITTGTADLQLSGGSHSIFISDDGCDTAFGGTDPVSINVLGGQANTAILNGGLGQTGYTFGITFGQNDTSTTPAGTARLTLRHGNTFLAQVSPSICLDGEEVDADPVPFNEQNQVEVPAGTYTFGLNIPGLTDGCEGDTELNLAECTNLVLNLFAGPGNTTFPTPPTDDVAGVDTEFFIVGCELPTSDQDTPAFCTVVNPGLLDIEALITDLFSPVVVGDEDTYPPAADLEALVDLINATTAEGDETVPDTIKPQWLILTDGLRELAAALTAAGFDLASPLLDEDAVQQIVDFALGSGEPDPETEAATAVLTEWFIANCFASPAAVVAAPTFTG